MTAQRTLRAPPSGRLARGQEIDVRLAEALFLEHPCPQDFFKQYFVVRRRGGGRGCLSKAPIEEDTITFPTNYTPNSNLPRKGDYFGSMPELHSLTYFYLRGTMSAEVTLAV